MVIFQNRATGSFNLTLFPMIMARVFGQFCPKLYLFLVSNDLNKRLIVRDYILAHYLTFHAIIDYFQRDLQKILWCTFALLNIYAWKIAHTLRNYLVNLWNEKVLIKLSKSQCQTLIFERKLNLIKVLLSLSVWLIDVAHKISEFICMYPF